MPGEVLEPSYLRTSDTTLLAWDDSGVFVAVEWVVGEYWNGGVGIGLDVGYDALSDDR